MALRAQPTVAEIMAPAPTLPERSIPVEEIGDTVDLSFIPESVSSFLTLGDRCLSLGSSNPHYIASRSSHNSHPINLELDIPEDLHREFKAQCVRSGFRVTPEGNVSRGDCLIYAQDRAARDRELRLIEKRMLARRHGASDLDSLNDLIPPEFAADNAVSIQATLSVGR